MKKENSRSLTSFLLSSFLVNLPPSPLFFFSMKTKEKAKTKKHKEKKKNVREHLGYFTRLYNKLLACYMKFQALGTRLQVCSIALRTDAIFNKHRSKSSKIKISGQIDMFHWNIKVKYQFSITI